MGDGTTGTIHKSRSKQHASQFKAGLVEKNYYLMQPFLRQFCGVVNRGLALTVCVYRRICIMPTAEGTSVPLPHEASPANKR